MRSYEVRLCETRMSGDETDDLRKSDLNPVTDTKRERIDGNRSSLV
jgi:hypothetical protein